MAKGRVIALNNPPERATIIIGLILKILEKANLLQNVIESDTSDSEASKEELELWDLLSQVRYLEEEILQILRGDCNRNYSIYGVVEFEGKDKYEKGWFKDPRGSDGKVTLEIDDIVEDGETCSNTEPKCEALFKIHCKCSSIANSGNCCDKCR